MKTEIGMIKYDKLSGIKFYFGSIYLNKDILLLS